MPDSARRRLEVVEIKAFVPARDFAVSKQFYADIGFTMASDGGGVAYFHFGNASFLLRDFCADGFAENVMMHLLVKNVQAWRDRIAASGVVARYGVTLSDIELQPWGMRDFCLTDPSGVLWRIGENVGPEGGLAVKIQSCRERLEVRDADLSGSEFSNARLAGATFENIDMSGCRLNDVKLAGTAITNVNLKNVTIAGANMEGMTIDGILVSDLLRAYLATH